MRVFAGDNNSDVLIKSCMGHERQNKKKDKCLCL